MSQIFHRIVAELSQMNLTMLRITQDEKNKGPPRRAAPTIHPYYCPSKNKYAISSRLEGLD